MGYGCACSFHGIAELLINKRARSYGVSLNCQEKFREILLFFFRQNENLARLYHGKDVIAV